MHDVRQTVLSAPRVDGPTRVQIIRGRGTHEPCAQHVGVPPSGGCPRNVNRLKPGHQLRQPRTGSWPPMHIQNGRSQLPKPVADDVRRRSGRPADETRMASRYGHACARPSPSHPPASSRRRLRADGIPADGCSSASGTPPTRMPAIRQARGSSNAAEVPPVTRRKKCDFPPPLV